MIERVSTLPNCYVCVRYTAGASILGGMGKTRPPPTFWSEGDEYLFISPTFLYDLAVAKMG